MNTIDEIYNAYIEAEAICRKTNEKICEKELSINTYKNVSTSLTLNIIPNKSGIQGIIHI